MSWQPDILNPIPDPAFVAELRKIDPALRVVWAYYRYLRRVWAIERRLSPERYAALYGSLFDEHHPRFVDQPIFDDSQPLYDQDGNECGQRIVGYRRYDLAPEWEWVQFVENSDGSFRPLDSRTLLALRRAYAWERGHSLTRLRLERQAEEERHRATLQAETGEIVLESVDRAWSEHSKRIVADASPKRLARTEV